MFRRLFTSIVLSAVFVGGYYVGRLPGSPDIFAYAQRAYQEATKASQAVTDAVSDQTDQADQAAKQGESSPFSFDAKGFLLGRQEKSDS